MKILIEKPTIKNVGGGKTRINYNLVYPDGNYELWYEVEDQYSEYLCDEISDAAVVCLLLWAMERGYDIESTAPISERLNNQLNNYLIPAISKNINRYKPISVIANVLDICFNPKGVGTGLSCGVDSFYTVMKNITHGSDSALNITHLCFFNAGSMGLYGGESARKTYEDRIKKFKKVADKLNLKFLGCDSNMSEFLIQENEMSHVFRTLSVPLTMQKLFSCYYFASSYIYADFKFTDFDPSYYDILTLPLLSNQNTRFELVGAETTRIGKMSYISGFDIVKNNLHVCITDVGNCGHCRKCKRTMLDAEIIGKLDEYKNVFDIDTFKKNSYFNHIWALLNFWRVDMPEICKALFRQNKINITHIICAMIAFPFYYVLIIAKKIMFKLSVKLHK